MTAILKPTDADIRIAECIENKTSFAVIAGAGSGKTTSLVGALQHIKASRGKTLRRDGQRILCITYTKRAVEVISERLGFDDLFYVSTIHSFLWNEISRFQKPLRRALSEEIIPRHIQKARDDDNGGNSQKAIKARKKLARLEEELEALCKAPLIKYEETNVSNYSKCILNHDDVIDVASHLISTEAILQRGLGFKYPYIFVDEAQDTFPQVISALNAICSEDGLPIIGYFGDPMQQIYDKRSGDFAGPEGAITISKPENFRCSTTVIELLNNFRNDLVQVPGERNAKIKGSVEIILAQAPIPGGPRKTYTSDQLDEVSATYEEALGIWGWKQLSTVKSLFLARRMIARRLGFVDLHKLFTGKYSSERSQSDFEDGSHHLLKPFVDSIFPLVSARRRNDAKAIINILRSTSPAFADTADNKARTLKNMLDLANQHSEELEQLWENGSTKEMLLYCRDHQLIQISDRLSEQLSREPREVYDEENEDHQREKGDWLADEFFTQPMAELEEYIGFLDENSPFSTQHGVKGEEYENVLVLIDDIEAAWNQYSFSKILTPGVAGDPTERQKELTEKLAYVCFSRAKKNLRILLFSQDAKAAGTEVIASGLFAAPQVKYL